MKTNLSYRIIQENDLAEICKLPQNADELFFMFPKAQYPLTLAQLGDTLKNRFDPTIILCDEEIVGFANFYELERNHYCSIGNVIVKSSFRNGGIGKFLIKTMENIALEKYQVLEYRLSCFNTNTNGILLYSKLDYKPFEIERREDKSDKPLALNKEKKADFVIKINLDI